VIALTPEAANQLESLEQFYIENQRPQALRNLAYAVAEASLIILNAPERGAAAPRPYPYLADLGFRWIKRGRYWIAYRSEGPAIVGIFFETDDIPSRI
jgi:plasmid stabilization system protein ParE